MEMWAHTNIMHFDALTVPRHARCGARARARHLILSIHVASTPHRPHSFVHSNEAVLLQVGLALGDALVVGDARHQYEGEHLGGLDDDKRLEEARHPRCASRA